MYSFLGLSPRVRGKRHQLTPDDLLERSIPACAGETGHAPYTGGMRPVYPRVCGGNLAYPDAAVEAGGLSPRVRGKLPGKQRRAAIPGSIPACAGETTPGSLQPDGSEVYPRVCGGNPRPGAQTRRRAGLSPRVRGKHQLRRATAAGRGSIPACAGETVRHSSRLLRPGVYPRVCGGNAVGTTAGHCRAGLSPRVRGKPITSRSVQLERRSIPACAGETAPGCGAGGSIPACAGETLAW